jgi:hypothetical protein
MSEAGLKLFGQVLKQDEAEAKARAKAQADEDQPEVLPPGDGF